MKKHSFIFLAVILGAGLHGQSIDEIKRSDRYLWGIGEERSLNRADKEALNDLVSQISVQVESSFSNIVQADNRDVSEFTEIAMNTYSATTLNLAQRRVEEKDGKTIVLRYIEKENIKKIFENRQTKILDYLASAGRAEDDGRIGDALKYYTWTLALLRSHPDVNTIQGETAHDGTVSLITWLPEKITRILRNLDIRVSKVTYSADEQKKTVLLDISFDGEPVSNLDYIYYTGDSWTTHLSSVKDGLGVVEYYGISAEALNDLRVKVEYRYDSRSKFDVELMDVMDNTDIPVFTASDIRMPLQIRESRPQAVKPKVETLNRVESKRSQVKVVENIVDAIEKGDFSSIADDFTPDGKDMFTRLLGYGNAELLNTGELDLQMIQMNDQVVVRSVPMKFSFPGNNREFIEDVVFTLDSNGQVDGVSFALGDRAVSDIMGKNERFGSLEQKQQIVRFMEDYKTAYCLERLDYLESVFADNALILVGHVLKQGENIDEMYRGKLSNEDVQYIRLSKSEYMERLRRIFNTSEFVNIHFEETDVKKVGGDDMVYGIQIAQNYNSVSYADFGYLFLMFDLNNVKEPKIHVRSWQPEKNTDGRIMGLEDFIF